MTKNTTIAVSIENVSKNFKLSHERVDSVKSLFVNPFKLKNAKQVEVQKVLRGVDFQIDEGEFFGIVGRNGSGKSTLLKIIAGIYQPTKGKVSINGRLVPFIELGVGFNPELTGRENVYLNGALMGYSTSQIDKRYQEIVDFAELERFMDQQLKNYSSGMQVRLAFSVATILAHSDILLIDEVLAVGDASFQRKCFEYFKQLKKEKKTVIFVTHDMNAVREYCDRAIMIEQGKIVASGSPEEVATAYSRMFAEEIQSSKIDSQKNRWGTKEVQFKSVNVVPEKITDSEANIEVVAKLKSAVDINEPVIGFSIADSAGTILLGTNNKIEHHKIGILTKGQQVTLKWRIPNIFNDGKYTVTVAAAHDNGVEVYDWWNEATSFKAINDKKTPYIIAPRIDMTSG